MDLSFLDKSSNVTPLLVKLYDSQQLHNLAKDEQPIARAELTSAVRDSSGEIVEGSTTEIKRQRDNWAFARKMGSDDPNWLLVSTDA